MKYPQLVSTRAVNAISDWLVSRLERLGVDAPLVYSRLLLSLLHTPLQINALDLAESVSSHQLRLKKNNGCFGRRSGSKRIGRRLTSSESETLKRFAAVESLMDVATSDQLKTEVEALIDELCEKLREIEKQNLDSDFIIIKETVDEAVEDNNTNTKTASTNQKLLDSKLDKQINDDVGLLKSSSNIDEIDPTKRYYRAFPSLSKELGSKILINNQLMWPTTTLTSNTTTTTLNTITSITTNTAGVKRKTKRRRNNSNNQGLMNNNLTNNKEETQKLSSSSSLNNHHNHNNLMNHNKKGAAILWDTNFEGTWEMGHDLISDFMAKINSKRNRSISENDAFVVDHHNYNHQFIMDHNQQQQSLSNDGVFSPSTSSTTSTNKTNSSFNYNINPSSMIRDEGYATPDTLTSFCELNDIVNDAAGLLTKNDNGAGGNNHLLEEPRRLYMREVSNESINDDDNDSNLAMFKAKFNSSVEALWDDNNNNKDSANEVNHDFWSNYYKHQYNAASDHVVIEPIQSNQPNQHQIEQFCTKIYGNMMPSEMLMLSAMSSDYGCGNAFAGNVNKRHDFIEAGTNLQSSIWSNNPEGACSDVGSECGGGGGLYAREIWDKIDSNNKNENPINQSTQEITPGYSIDNYVNFSKWSDCSYETPFVSNSAPQSLPPLLINSSINENAIINQQQPNIISLPNHSEETSGFNKVYPKKVNHFEYYDRQYKCGLDSNRKRYSQEIALLSEDENLLTSERTHFRPINKQTYIDGYTFDIPCQLDEINYQRSESGSMYHDSDKYMELKLPNGDSSGDQFMMKFCVKHENNNKYCQTENDEQKEENDLIRFDNSEQQKYVEVVGVIGKNDYRLNHDVIDIDDVDMECLREQTRLLNYCICYDQKYQTTQQIISCSVHPLSNSAIENWSLNQMKTKCLNNNYCHTLWGHCSTCNTDVNQLPADHLMKAELNADGDEIMSDLKYMQNLFIGADWDDQQIVVEVNDIRDDDDFDDVSLLINNNNNNNILPLEDNKLLVNKLISDLLKPETTKSITQVLGSHQSKTIFKEIALNDKKPATSTGTSIFSNHNNNNYISCGVGFSGININNNNNLNGLWMMKKERSFDDQNNDADDAGDWGNSKNLKSIIENENFYHQNNLDNFKSTSSDHQYHHQNLQLLQEEEFKNINFNNNLIDVVVVENNNIINNNNNVDGPPSNSITVKSLISNLNNNNCNNVSLLKRVDRKRRHSSSQQNFSGGNEVIDSIVGLGLSGAGKLFHINANVITCNYWTADFKYLPKYEGDIKVSPSSILKHIAMVSSRPLTR